MLQRETLAEIKDDESKGRVELKRFIRQDYEGIFSIKEIVNKGKQ